MKDEPFELVHGSGNVFRDFGHPNADVEQMKALLAAEIIKTLNAREADGARGPCADRDCSGGLLADSQRRLGPVHT